MTEDNKPASQLPDWITEHMQKYLETNGENGHIWHGVPTLLLTTRGRKTGNSLTLPLIYGQSGKDFVVVGSKGGNNHHPHWYLNLVAGSRVQVQVAAEHFDAIARDATTEERPRLWQAMVKIWPAYAEYQGKTSREIPLIILERL